MQEVWEKKRKKGKIIIINKKLTGKINNLAHNPIIQNNEINFPPQAQMGLQI